MPDRSQRIKPGDKRQIEFRAFYHGTGLDTLQARADGDEPGFSGHASTWWEVDSYGTAMQPGAFTKTLQERAGKCGLLWQHDPYVPIGGAKRLEQDGTGLAFDAKVTTTTQAGHDAMELLRDDNIADLGMSFGFRTVNERTATSDDPLVFGPNTPEWAKMNPDRIYVITEIKLWEISLVTFRAAYGSQVDTVRSGLIAEALPQLLEDLRAGRLDPASRALVQQLVAAWQAAPEGDAPPRTDAKAPQTSSRWSIVQVLAAECGIPVENIA